MQVPDDNISNEVVFNVLERLTMTVRQLKHTIINCLFNKKHNLTINK